jgi:hypothetical protein
MRPFLRKNVALGLALFVASTPAQAGFLDSLPVIGPIVKKAEEVPVVGGLVKVADDTVTTVADGGMKVAEGGVKALGGIAKCIGGNCEQGKKDIQDGVKAITTGTIEIAVGTGVAVFTAADPLIGVLTFGAPSPLQGIAKFLYDVISHWKGHPDCNPQEQLNRLMNVPKRTLGDGDRLAGLILTPAKYISSIFDGIGAWEPTGCDAVGFGVPIRDAQISTDGLWTVDVQLLEFDIQGLKAGPGRFIRLEIIPGVPAHASASAHNPRPSDVIRFGGPMIWDKDSDSDHPHGHMEVHPYGELEFGAKPTGSPAPPSSQQPLATQTATPIQPAGPAEYEVRRGDCLSRIAERFYGEQRWRVVYCANLSKIKDPDLIYPGQRFRLPLPGERVELRCRIQAAGR